MISGILLAGGASRRMGFDKRFATVAGTTLLQRGIDLLQLGCDDVVVCVQANEAALLAEPNVRWLPDQHAFAGPLPAITRALSYARHPLCVVHACDMPNVSSLLLKKLTDAAQRHAADIAVPCWQSRLQPLPAVFRSACQPQLLGHLAAGEHSLYSALALKTLTIARVELAEQKPDIDWSTTLQNCNLPKDLPSDPSGCSVRRAPRRTRRIVRSSPGPSGHG